MEAADSPSHLINHGIVSPGAGGVSSMHTAQQSSNARTSTAQTGQALLTQVVRGSRERATRTRAKMWTGRVGISRSMRACVRTGTASIERYCFTAFSGDAACITPQHVWMPVRHKSSTAAALWWAASLTCRVLQCVCLPACECVRVRTRWILHRSDLMQDPRGKREHAMRAPLKTSAQASSSTETALSWNGKTPAGTAVAAALLLPC